MKNKGRILSTAPLSASLVELAEQSGVALDVVPFTEISFVEDEHTEAEIKKLYGQQLTVVFTSANAVAGMANCATGAVPDWKIYCIGNATKEKAAAQFAPGLIKGTAANSADLAKLMVAEGVRDVVFFCGNKRLDTLPDYLKQSGAKVTEVVVYCTKETPHSISKDYNAVLFFCPSGVRSFFSINKIKDDVALFAIGNTTAGAIKQYSDNKIIISTTPSRENMVTIALQHLPEKVGSK